MTLVAVQLITITAEDLRVLLSGADQSQVGEAVGDTAGATRATCMCTASFILACHGVTTDALQTRHLNVTLLQQYDDNQVGDHTSPVSRRLVRQRTEQQARVSSDQPCF